MVGHLVVTWHCAIVGIRGGIKKLFVLSFPERGGGLAESKISLTEKIEIFLDFLAERGGVSPNPKGF